MATHTPDQVFISPIFVAEQLVGFTHSWAHFLDIGGTHSGSATPDATEIFHEGILIPPVRLYREGVLNEDLFRTFVRNSRFPDMIKGGARHDGGGGAGPFAHGLAVRRGDRSSGFRPTYSTDPGIRPRPARCHFYPRQL
ncbi:hydantoinase B/oxoprolinase family protein [Candidatus Sodalis pierantonius]|uniref:hydantoinase B/oxoprolinase family protein n=1 Tax=Candidatus Sodalis pierantonii TaxID=1486991 RepID=UPI003AA8F18C